MFWKIILILKFRNEKQTVWPTRALLRESKALRISLEPERKKKLKEKKKVFFAFRNSLKVFFLLSSQSIDYMVERESRRTKRVNLGSFSLLTEKRKLVFFKLICVKKVNTSWKHFFLWLCLVKVKKKKIVFCAKKSEN